MTYRRLSGQLILRKMDVGEDSHVERGSNKGGTVAPPTNTARPERVGYAANVLQITFVETHDATESLVGHHATEFTPSTRRLWHVRLPRFL